MFYPQGNFLSNWQHPAQLAALPQQALQQFLAPQFSSQLSSLPFSQPFSQPFNPQYSLGANPFNGLNGLANGAAQSAGMWQQPQAGPEQISSALLHQAHLLQQSQQQFLQRLAQFHYSFAQQLAQLAAQQIPQNPGNPYASPFIPSQLGANFVPGITMH